MNEDDKYLNAIEKLALGYEYEEIQTLIEDTPSGQKKKIIRTKKHCPPNLAAAQYMRRKKQTTNMKGNGHENHNIIN